MDSSKLSSKSAVVGCFAWMGLLFAPFTVTGEMADVAMLLLLGILVIVPWALDVAAPGGTGKHSLPFQLAIWLQPIGAIGAGLSFFWEVGWAAALLVIPWLAFAICVALEGFRRLIVSFQDKSLAVHSVVTSIGLIYLPGGAGWLFLSRLGVDPGPYGELIVLLTAVHFHFAAFVAPVWAGALGSALTTNQSRLYSIFRVVGIGLVVGTPLVALGIAGSTAVETIGVLVLATSAFGLGVLGLLQSVRFPDRNGAVMLAVSAGSLCVAMLWAFAFNLGPRFGWASPDIVGMIPRHGWLNGVGFALVGMLAWRRLQLKCDC